MAKTTKKMTLNEFKAALKAADYDLDTWGWDGILNVICCMERHTADEMASLGFDAAARGAKKRRDTLFEILDKRGFYDDVLK